jgi:hypothetical protein
MGVWDTTGNIGEAFRKTYFELLTHVGRGIREKYAKTSVELRINLYRLQNILQIL